MSLIEPSARSQNTHRPHWTSRRYLNFKLALKKMVTYKRDHWFTDNNMQRRYCWIIILSCRLVLLSPSCSVSRFIDSFWDLRRKYYNIFHLRNNQTQKWRINERTRHHLNLFELDWQTVWAICVTWCFTARVLVVCSQTINSVGLDQTFNDPCERTGSKQQPELNTEVCFNCSWSSRVSEKTKTTTFMYHEQLQSQRASALTKLIK